MLTPAGIKDHTGSFGFVGNPSAHKPEDRYHIALVASTAGVYAAPLLVTWVGGMSRQRQ